LVTCFFRFSHATAAEQRPKNEITWQAALKDTASRMLLHQPCFGQACFDQKRRDELFKDDLIADRLEQ
jgi:hypothetical protein